MGSGAAGTVEEVGEGVTNFSKGDRVMTQGHFSDNYGGFQQYLAIPAAYVALIPNNLSFTDAVTLPLCIFTPALGLYYKTGANLTPPWDAEGKGKYKGQAAVVFGGASSVGQFAILLLKLSGFSEIITTASPSNEDLVKSLGATHFIDRNAPVEPAVKAIATCPVTIVVDAVSAADTQASGFDIVAPGGALITFLGNQVPEDKQKEKNASIYPVEAVFTAENEPFRRLYYSKLTKFVEENHIPPTKVEILPGGLNGITAGLERLEKNQVSGAKLVVLPQESA